MPPLAAARQSREYLIPLPILKRMDENKFWSRFNIDSGIHSPPHLSGLPL
jgi:hypothetical protein